MFFPIVDSVLHQAGRETLEKHDGVNELWLTAISYYIGQKVYTNWYKSKVKFENQQNCAMNAIWNYPLWRTATFTTSCNNQ